jgi:palmitoyltransferase
MWAAYQGDGLSVELLLGHGASITTRDHAGLSPLHWAVVKGSVVCIKHLLLAGADFNAREEQGKTPRDMADELKAAAPLNRALQDANFNEYGQRVQSRFSPRVTMGLIFAFPLVVLSVSFTAFGALDWYFSWPLFLAMFAGMQIVSHQSPSRATLADFRPPSRSSSRTSRCRTALSPPPTSPPSSPPPS